MMSDLECLEVLKNRKRSAKRVSRQAKETETAALALKRLQDDMRGNIDLALLPPPRGENLIDRPPNE
jgi:hypothetical protein